MAPPLRTRRDVMVIDGQSFLFFWAAYSTKLMAQLEFVLFINKEGPAEEGPWFKLKKKVQLTNTSNGPKKAFSNNETLRRLIWRPNPLKGP